MLRLPPDHVRFYEDGPDWPQSPQQQMAERAYRDAFLTAAREAGRWTSVDEAAIRKAWDELRRAREEACVLVPSSVLFERGDLRGEQMIYTDGYQIAAARTRGRVHGLEFVRQCWDELVQRGVDPQVIGPVIIAPWVEHVAEWVARDIDPERINPPPRPDDKLTERQRRMLEEAKRIIADCDPNKPHAILQRLTGVARELLDWLWPGRIPLGKLTLLAGDPGLGKSFVTLDIAARVSRGDAWPDTPLLRQTPGDVVLLNAEDDLADTIAPRLDKAGADDSRIVAIEGVSLLGKRRHFSLEQDLPRLEEVLVGNPGTRLIVVDPISAYTGKVDSHKNSEVRGLLAPLAELAGRHRVAIVTVTHLSKGASTKAVYRAMGSLAFAAAARAVWAVVKDQHDPQRRLFLPAKLNLAQDRIERLPPYATRPNVVNHARRPRRDHTCGHGGSRLDVTFPGLNGHVCSPRPLVMADAVALARDTPVVAPAPTRCGPSPDPGGSPQSRRTRRGRTPPTPCDLREGPRLGRITHTEPSAGLPLAELLPILCGFGFWAAACSASVDVRNTSVSGETPALPTRRFLVGCFLVPWFLCNRQPVCKGDCEDCEGHQ